jgi:hypothetical protein
MNGRSDPARRPRRPSGGAPPAAPAWLGSLPFFLVGGVTIGVAAILLSDHSSAALVHLPVWTYLLAIGSIALIGGTVATFVGEPIPDLPEENELVGADLIVVSRARWKDLNKMERWVEDRISSAPEPPPPAPARVAPADPRPAGRSPPTVRTRTRSARGAIPNLLVPTIDDLLEGLPTVSDADLAAAELWRETDDSREIPPPPLPPVGLAPRPRTAPAPVPAPARPVPAERSAPRARPNVDLDRLLTELEREAAKVAEDQAIEAALTPSSVLHCAGCGRGVAITERWEHCDRCLSAYCADCENRVQMVGDRSLCAACRAAPRRRRR